MGELGVSHQMRMSSAYAAFAVCTRGLHRTLTAIHVIAMLRYWHSLSLSLPPSPSLLLSFSLSLLLLAHLAKRTQ
jgi:hypothetical protein